MKHIYTKPMASLAFFLLAFSQMLTAQDPRFSQYYASPWNLNPALTGVFNGRWRATANYRDQWGSFLSPVPFRTYAAAVETELWEERRDGSVMISQVGTPAGPYNCVPAEFFL